MLVLSRKVGERILIGGNIAVTVVRLNSGSVRLGVEAPANLAVVREELQDRIALETTNAPDERSDREPS